LLKELEKKNKNKNNLLMDWTAVGMAEGVKFVSLNLVSEKPNWSLKSQGLLYIYDAGNPKNAFT
jgi:hypothetical protein